MIAPLDYKLLQAFAATIKAQSFAQAADMLCITQSAISQRIKQLEQNIAQPVLIRGQPLRATEIGKKLLNHYHQVVQLEADIYPELHNEAPQKALTIHLATNADSLATWLIPAISSVIKSNLIELNLLIADENYTVQKLKDGEAFGAISEQEQAVKGCQVTCLGKLNYILVASQEFKENYFKKGINQKTLKRAPGVAFDQKDNMHVNFIKDTFDLCEGEYPLHAVRSSEAFVALAKHGAAYCFISELQIKNELQSGELVNLLPDLKLEETLYWHRWTLLKGIHKLISDAIITNGKKLLTK